MFFNRLPEFKNRFPNRARRPMHRDSRLLLELLEDRRLLSGTPAEALGYGNLPLAFEANQGQVDRKSVV